MFIEKDGYYKIDEFEKYGVMAVFTGEKLGNMSDFVLNAASAKKNRENFLKEMGLEKRHLVYARQVHSAKVVDIDQYDEKYFYDGVDGFISRRGDIVVFTQYADCLPIYYYDTEKKVFGLCHAGWKGSFDGIQKEVLRLMEETYACSKKDIIIGLGIGIGPCCYEVQEEFYLQYKERYPDIYKEVFLKKESKLYYDNEKFNYLVLLQMGLPKENIVRSNMCTYCGGNFYSYRRQGKDAGRNGAFIYFK